MENEIESESAQVREYGYEIMFGYSDDDYS